MHLQVDDEVKPTPGQCHLHILREKVEAKLDRLPSIGVISPVKTAAWAAPTLKKNGAACIMWGLLRK